MIAATFKCLFDHTYSLLLVAERRETTEGHVIGPVEPSKILRMLHALRPIRLRFEVLGNLTALLLVFDLWRILVLHQGAVKHVHFEGLLLLFGIHLLDKLVEFLCGRLTDKILSLWRIVCVV